MIDRLSRRGFLAAVGASTLTACGRGGSERVRILCGSGAGAASDALVRLFARHLGRFGVKASVENVPRGGGQIAARTLTRAPNDGSVMAILPTSLLYAQLLAPAAVEWDLASLSWLGGFGMDHRALIVTGKSGVHRFEDLLTRPRPLIVSSSTSIGQGVYEAAIIRYLTGARLQIVPGFTGGARLLALISGEVEGTVSALDGAAAVLDIPGTRILLRVNDLPLPPGIPRSAGVDVPKLRDFCRNSPDDEPLLALTETHNRLGRIMALPPHTPAAVLERQRALFTKVLADAEFREEAARQHVLIEHMPGAEIAALLDDVLRTRRSLVEPALHRALRNWADPPPRV